MPQLKIATWNVNSIKVRLEHVQNFLTEYEVDALLVQETKSEDKNFPEAALKAAGYYTAFYGQKTYNGVAIISRLPLTDVVYGMPGCPDEGQKRVMAASIIHEGQVVRLVSVYVPQGENLTSEKYVYKLGWLEDYNRYLAAQQKEYGAVAAGGDYNIAPSGEDIYDPDYWGERVSASPPERAALTKLLELGYTDAQKMFPPPPNPFTWWDYRTAGFKHNRGLRIDLFLLTAPLKTMCASCHPVIEPRGWERPSDHAPVLATFI